MKVGHSSIKCIKIHDGKLFCTNSQAMLVFNLNDDQMLYQIEGIRQVSTFEIYDGKIFAPNGDSIQVWDEKTRIQIGVLTGHIDSISSICVVAGKIFSYSHLSNRTLRLWSISLLSTKDNNEAIFVDCN